MPVTYRGTRDIPLDQLTRFPGNARRGDVDRIRESIRRHGQYRSLVVRDTGDALIILAGNHTRDAIAAEGHTTARCEVVECTDDEARRINLADNRLTEIGDYDNDALAELLSYLDDDYTGSGWTPEEVEALLNASVPPSAEEWGAAFDSLPEGEKTHSQRTFNLRVEQAEIVDRAVEAAAEALVDDDGNRNAAALTAICETYLRDQIGR